MKGRRKSLKTVVTAIVIVLCMLQIPFKVFAKTPIPAPFENIFVNDFANVLSEDEEMWLIENATELFNNYNGVEIVVSTMNTLDRYTLEDFYTKDFLKTCDEEELQRLKDDLPERFATEMYNQYEIGTNDMGLLILLVIEDGDIEVKVGKGLEPYIPNSKCGRFIDDYALGYFIDHQFSEGLMSLQSAYISEIENCLGTEIVSDSDVNESSHINVSLIILLIFIILALIFVILYLIHKLKRQNYLLKELAETLSISSDSLNDKIQLIEKNFSAEKLSIRKNFQTENASMRKKYSNEIQEYTKQISNLENENKALLSKFRSLENSYLTLKDRYSMILSLYPSADEEVSKMIEEEIKQANMQKAASVDDIISRVIDSPASKELIPEIKSALSAYSSLEDVQKSFVTSDVEKLNQLYTDSLAAQAEYERKLEEERIRQKQEQDRNTANYAMKQISDIISHIRVASYSNLHDLRIAKNIYTSLDSDASEYFDSSLLNRLNLLLHDAEEERRRKEEREQREREEREKERMEKELRERRERERLDRELREKREKERREKEKAQQEKNNQRRQEERRIHSSSSYHSSSSSQRSSSSSHRSSSSSQPRKSSSVSSHKGHGGQTRGAGASRKF